MESYNLSLGTLSDFPWYPPKNATNRTSTKLPVTPLSCFLFWGPLPVQGPCWFLGGNSTREEFEPRMFEGSKRGSRIRPLTCAYSRASAGFGVGRCLVFGVFWSKGRPKKVSRASFFGFPKPKRVATPKSDEPAIWDVFGSGAAPFGPQLEMETQQWMLQIVTK